jgi:DNA-directed RNA polymerase specialized sigma24 family protein
VTTETQVVADFEKWAHHRAGQMVTRDHHLYDDLVQEALIEIWRVHKAKGDPSAVLLAQKARYRMLNIVTGDRPMVGGDSTPGPKSRPTTTNVDWANADEVGLEHLLAAPDALEAVDWAYHEGELQAALSALTPEQREYVTLRFWGGLRDVDIEAQTGIGRKVLGNRWTRSIKPILQRELAHLDQASGT